MASLPSIDRDIRDTLSKEKGDKGLSKINEDFYKVAKSYLGILENMWRENQRGDPDAEKSYHKWKVARANVSDIFLNRLRKILTLVNRKIDGREPNTGNLLPDEKGLFAGLEFLARKSRKIIVDRSDEDGQVMNRLLDVIRSDPDGIELLESKPKRGVDTSYEVLSGGIDEKEPGEGFDVMEQSTDYLVDFDDLPPPAQEEESFVESYEEYREEEELGVGDIELEGGGRAVSNGQRSGSGPGAGNGMEDRERPEIGSGKAEYDEDRTDDQMGSGDTNRSDTEEAADTWDENLQDKTDVDGEVSNGTVERKGSKDTGGEKPHGPFMTIRILEDTGEFVSVDGNIYNLSKEEVASFPYNVANVLVAAKKAERIE